MFLDITWQDPVTGTHGFVVIDTLVRGSASGGSRMREGRTLEEVRGLAEGMTRKEAIHLVPGRRYVPLGGAKGRHRLRPARRGCHGRPRALPRRRQPDHAGVLGAR